jgi:hypothetical protein
MITGSDVYQDFVAEAKDEAELLVMARIHEWMSDLYLFSLECLGNNPSTDPKLGGNLEPRVAHYTRWVGDKVLDWLHNRADQKVRRKLMVLVPRECYKTTNITTSLPVWVQLQDPNISVVIDMAKMRNMADKTLAVVKEHMLGTRPTAKLYETFGADWHNSKRTWNDSAIVSGRRGDMARRDKTVEITSVDVGATGSHPDLWIWDDPVTRELANETWYKQCWDHYLGTLPIVRTDGMFILIMTRYGEGDPCGRIIDEEIAPKVMEKYGEIPEDFRRNWPKYAHLAGWDVLLDHGRNPEDASELYYPSIWTQERIEEYEGVSPAEFAAQVMNMPGERADQPLQREHIDRLWIDFDQVPPDVYNNIYIHCDLAWKNSKNYKQGVGDFSVIQVWGQDNAGYSYYMPLAYRGRDMQEQFGDQFIITLQQLAKHRARIRLLTYDKPTGGMGDSISRWFRDLCLKAGLRCPPILEMQRSSQDIKDDRAMMASRYWIDGTVKLVRHAPHVHVLVDEMLGIGVTRYDDMRDAAADHFHADVNRSRPNVSGFQPGHEQLSRPWDRHFRGGKPQQHQYVTAGHRATPLELELNRAARSVIHGSS